MASQNTICITFAIVFAVCVALACATPVPADAIDATDLNPIEGNEREGRFYGNGLAASQASAISSSSGGGYGGLGFPYGGGFGGSSAHAAASAQSLGYGK